MKKIMSILIVIAMMLSISIMPVYANPYAPYDPSSYKYFEEFVEYYGSVPMYDYDELYFYYAEETDEEPTWALVRAKNNADMWISIYGTNVGNRILTTPCHEKKSVSGYHVYVKELDTFLPVEEAQMDKIIECCPDFVKVIEENEFGTLIGDIDCNNVIEIIDATYLQRYLAEYTDLIGGFYNIYELTRVSGSIDVSDFDRDGETTVMDATMIQRHLVGLE